MNENKKLRSLIREMISISDVSKIPTNYETVVNKGMDKLVGEFTHRSGKLAQNALGLMREIESRKRIFSRPAQEELAAWHREKARLITDSSKLSSEVRQILSSLSNEFNSQPPPLPSRKKDIQNQMNVIQSLLDNITAWEERYLIRIKVPEMKYWKR
jgi:hypothetical protein